MNNIHGNRIYLLICILFLLVATGCQPAGPDYVPPAVLIPAQYQGQAAPPQPTAPSCPDDLSQWWHVFQDQTLTSLIQRSIMGSPDLKKAVSRIREARAQRGIAEGQAWPNVDASGSGAQNKSSNETGGGSTTESYSVGFDASWEVDLFGGNKRSVEAAQADIESIQEEYRDAMVTLTAEVALNYVNVRILQKRLAVAQQNVKAQTETRDIANYRFQAGLTTELDLQKAEYTLQSTQSQIPSLTTSLQEAQNRLAVLLGLPPGAVHNELAAQQPVPIAPLDIAIGVPADLLRRRPDVRQAERDLAAQTARVGEAMAERYPKLVLSGSIGLDALGLGNLLNLHNSSYKASTGISWPVFDAGAIRRNIQVQNELQEQALITYESTILTALEDVENALTAYAQEQTKRAALEKAVKAAQDAFDLASNQYSSGLVDFQDVLEAQRSLLSYQDDLATSEGEVTSDLIRLYKALGGGWTNMGPVEKKTGLVS